MKGYLLNCSLVYKGQLTKLDLGWGHHGRDHDRMVVGFTTTYAISAYHH